MSKSLQSAGFDAFASKLARMTGGVSKSYLEKLEAELAEIRQLKKEKNAVVLAHYYMPAALQILESEGGIADFIGDSLGLSVEATKVEADNIIFCGVSFMAETAKILNRGKNVLIPDKEAGCSLASSITGKDVISLRQQYPGVPVIAYVNTYAETKAECDICCTSRNAMKIARSFDSDRILFVPDKYMGKNLATRIKKETGKELILWDGACEVHEKFTSNIGNLIDAYPDAEVLLHWEVPENTVNDSLKKAMGIVGSTTDIIKHVDISDSRQFILGSECDLGATLRGMFPEKEFITPCVSCRFMKKITIDNTLDTLRAIGSYSESNYRIDVPGHILERAYMPIKKMIDLS